jgi:hypothetical protein
MPPVQLGFVNSSWDIFSECSRSFEIFAESSRTSHVGCRKGREKAWLGISAARFVVVAVAAHRLLASWPVTDTGKQLPI